MYQNATKHERDIKQDQLVKYILAGLSVTDAAKAIGTSRVTATRWLAEPHMKKALAEGKADIKKSAHDIIIERYTDALEQSIDVVIEVMGNKDLLTPAAARLKAVQMIQDRLAPIIAKPAVDPLQGSGEGMGVLVAHELIPYLAPEEMESIERFIGLAEQRKVQAEKDVETLERKRG